MSGCVPLLRAMPGQILLCSVFWGCLAPVSSLHAQQDQQKTDPRVIIAPYSPDQLRIAYQPPSGADRFEHEDEISFARALALIRSGREDEGRAELMVLLERYPTSARLISATATSWTRSKEPKKALRVISHGVSEIKKATRGQEQAPLPQPTFSIERSEAYIELENYEKAIPWMVEACDHRPTESQHLRSTLVDWASDAKLGPRIAREVGRRSDKVPSRVPLAMLATELEALAGLWEKVWPRLQAAEQHAVEGRRGELVRALGHRLSVRPGIPDGSDAPVWLELARGPYDPTLRIEGMQLLLRQGRGEKSADHVRADHLPPQEVFDVWQALPAGDPRLQLGFDLTAYYRERGEWDLANQVGQDLRQSDLSEGMLARVEYEQGLSALRGGNLEEAQTRLESARQHAAADDVRAPATFALAEARFYAADFEQAFELYDEFANRYFRDKNTNDALERIYLLESGSPLGGGVQRAPGLEALARGLYAENRSLWEVAADLARDAEAEARLAEQVESPVRAHAILLLSRAEEMRGFPEAALAAALQMAESLPEARLAPVGRKRAGDLYMDQGQLDEALYQYEELVSRYPDSWLAPEVRRLITELRGRGVQ